MIPNKLILEIEKTDKGYNITNGNSLDKENYAVKDRHQLSVVLHIFLNLLDNEDLDYDSNTYNTIID